MFTRKLWGPVGCGATLVAAALMYLTPSQAARPGGGDGGGSLPTGEIFFTWGSEFGGGLGGPDFEDRGFWRMDADGSGKQLRYRPEAHHLSHQLHGGHRWFLALGPSPSGSARGALFAVREDGHPDFIVPLLEVSDLGDRYITFSRWGKDDSFLGFSAIGGTLGVGEIWTMQVTFDELTGIPSAMLPEMVVEQPQADVSDFDFSPQGLAVVYRLNRGDSEDSPLLIKEFLAGSTFALAANGDRPVWSPDGNQIAFVVGDVGLHVINPDGTGVKVLSKETWGDYMGDWSPDGMHIVFTRLLRKSAGGFSVYSADVLRVTVSSGDTVNLTKDIDGTARAAFWR